MRFRLHEQIGGGGFADVFRATEEGVGTEVAIKMLREFRDEEARRRFRREGRILATIRHPSIVRILAADLHAERPWYAMPIMRWGTLEKWVGRTNMAVVRCIARSLASVLDVLHSRGALHRDLKPANILVDHAGHLAVGDFGLGNDPACTVLFTVAGAGTHGYAAPEVVAGGVASSSSDVYSLGATLFHVLTGRHPGGIATLDPQPLRQDVPADLRAITLRMVAHDPAMRPSAREVLSVLGGRHDYPAKVPRLASPWVQTAMFGLLLVGGLAVLRSMK